MPSEVDISKNYLGKANGLIEKLEAKAYKLINQMPVHQAKDSDREKEVGMIREDIADMKNLEKKHHELVSK